MDIHPFDIGKTVASGGYRWALSTFRQHYTTNVLGTRAMTHEAWCKEFPEAAAALEEADRQLAMWEKLAAKPESFGALMKIAEALAAGRAVKIQEQEESPAMPDHTHTMGEGDETGEAEGHKHKMIDGKIQMAMGHTHDMPTKQEA